MKPHLISRFTLLLTLLLSAGSVAVKAAPVTIPQAQAAHFCQLLINDDGEVYPLSYQAHHLLTPNDSLTVEQLFMTFIFHDDNWQVLRIFPHTADDGTVSWYVPIDALPASMDKEHQKYIREVMPRLQREVMAGNWPVVDDCIDKMIRYQCKYGGKSARTSSIPTYLFYIFALFLAFFWLFTRLFVTLRPKRNNNERKILTHSL